MAIPAPISLGDDDSVEKIEKTYNFEHGKILDLTPEAVAQVKAFALSNAAKIAGKHFRVLVEGGGCSGLQYGFTFDAPQPDDHQVPCEDITVLVSEATKGFVNGAVVDYVVNQNGAGFIVKNPQAKAECGCGISFTV